MAKNFSELRDKMSPERQARVAERTKEMLADMEENKVATRLTVGCTNCPHCGAKLDYQHEGQTYFRTIGIYDYRRDRTVAVRCPDCKKEDEA